MSRKFVPLKVPTRNKEPVQQEDQNSNPENPIPHQDRGVKGSVKVIPLIFRGSYLLRKEKRMSNSKTQEK
jgi:hypothetical protein